MTNIHKIALSRYRTKRIAVVLLSLTVIFGLLSPYSNTIAKTSVSTTEINESSGIVDYNSYLRGYNEKDIPLFQGKDLSIAAENYSKVSSKDGIELKTQKLDSYVQWGNSTDWMEWEIDLPQEGLYRIDINYLTINDSGIMVQRSITINDKTPFDKAAYFGFRMFWRDDNDAPVYNSAGDQIQPTQQQIGIFDTFTLSDPEGFNTEPYRFYFNKGINRIRMTYLEQDFGIKSITVGAPRQIRNYEEVKAEYKDNNYQKATQTIRFEAEKNIAYKSDGSLQVYADSDPKSTPYKFGYKRINAIGGGSWNKGGQALCWDFNVKEEGLYKIFIRAQNSWGEKLSVFREIEIDGSVPFRELLDYEIIYDKEWQTVSLGEKGEEYEFYFKPGSHKLKMTAKIGPMTDMITSFNTDSLKISDMLLRITMVTGSTPDPNYIYDLKLRIPTIQNELKTLKNSVISKRLALEGLKRGGSSIISSLKQIEIQLDSFLKDPEIIPARVDELNMIMSTLGNWYKVMQNQSLGIDFIQITPPETPLEQVNSTLLERIKATVINVYMSYFKDYNNINTQNTNENATKQIDVWTSTGFEWGNILRRQIDESFTPENGIKVNLNILPAGQVNAGQVNAVMLSVIGGNSPDAALGLDVASPVEFAMRNVSYDLTNFKDFSTMESQFTSESFIPFQYKSGIFALPQAMDFKVLFFRKDIIEKYKIPLPDTWQDLYENVLPVLYDNKLSCFIPQDLSIFLFQNGGSLFTEDTLKSNLGTPEAYKAFKQMVELNTRYGIPVTTNFFNRFRTGETPMGISTMGDYMQILIAAPELSGRWGIAPIPGTVESDGTINRSVGGLVNQSCVVLNQSNKKDQAWTFLKWWMSTKEQTKYGREVEAIIGSQARWNSANVNAFKNQNWRKNDLSVIIDSWKLQKETPNVPGAYMTSREISNAWNRMILNNSSMTLRDSLELAVKNINLEMKQKQKEFDYTGIPVG